MKRQSGWGDRKDTEFFEPDIFLNCWTSKLRQICILAKSKAHVPLTAALRFSNKALGNEILTCHYHGSNTTSGALGADMCVMTRSQMALNPLWLQGMNGQIIQLFTRTGGPSRFWVRKLPTCLAWAWRPHVWRAPLLTRVWHFLQRQGGKGSNVCPEESSSE